MYKTSLITRYHRNKVKLKLIKITKPNLTLFLKINLWLPKKDQMNFWEGRSKSSTNLFVLKNKDTVIMKALQTQVSITQSKGTLEFKILM